MEKSVKLLAVFLIFSTLLIASVSALIIVGNNSRIETTYSQGDRLQGKINISFRGESINSTIRSAANSMNLSDFLEKNSLSAGTEYNCTPQDCEEYYQATNGATSKIFSLNYGQKKTLSFRIAGSSAQVSNIKFNINANNTSGCGSPLSIDLFNDGEINWKSRNFLNDFVCTYESGTGCYSSSSATSEVLLMGSLPFCEKINILETGQVRLGAWIKNSSTIWHPGILKMYLYELNSEQPLFSCDLPRPVENEGEIGCSPTTPFNNPTMKEYYVCIKPDSDTTYTIKKEDVAPCGFYGNPPENENTIHHDYSIFAKAAKFDKVGNFTFDSAEYSRQGNPGELVDDFSSYLDSKYAGNCTLGCAIPITFKAMKDINLEVSNVVLGYSTDSGPQPSENKVYDATINSPKINSGFLNLDLSKANLTVPSVYGETSVSIYIGNDIVLSQKINVARVPLIKRVYPNIVPAGIWVTITAEVFSFNKTISSYVWDFGDGSDPQTTTENHTRHIYGRTGTYTLTLTAIDEFGMNRSSDFAMMAGNPSVLVNNTIKEYRARVSNLTGQINSYPEWYRKALETKINIEELGDELTLLEKRLYLASTDEEYSSIMSNLTLMDMPIRLEETSSGNLPISIDKNLISLAVLEEIGAGEGGNNSEAYRDAIENWVNLNLDLTADFSIWSLRTDKGINPVLSYFKLIISPKEERDIESYLVLNGETVINSPDTKDIDDNTRAVTFTELKESQLEFVIFGDIPPQEIPIYLSPEFKDLQLSPDSTGKCNYDGICNKEDGENWRNCRKDCKPWGTAIIYLLILLFLAFAAYIGIQEWYKRKYEAYLFKNKNDLFNILNFINNALTKGLKKDEIEKSLKQYGWTSEQIVYAFKKIRGKKTGMPLEIKIPDIKSKKDDKNRQNKAF